MNNIQYRMLIRLITVLLFALLPALAMGCPLSAGKSEAVDILTPKAFIQNGEQPHFFSAMEPTNSAISNAGFIYLADSQAHQIKIADKYGNVMKIFGSQGEDPGQLLSPRGLALDSQTFIYIADTGNHRIQRFDKNGRFINSWGSYGTGPLQFKSPTGITVDKQYVYIADTGNNRIQVYDKSGRLIRSFGQYGSQDRDFNQPIGIATDSFGNLYIADSQNHQIKKYSRNGKFYQAWGSYGNQPAQLNKPFGVSINQGLITVSELGNHRIQTFKESGDFHRALTVRDKSANDINSRDPRVHYPASFTQSPSGKHQLYCLPLQIRCASTSNGIINSSVTMEDSPRWESGPSAIHYSADLALSNSLIATLAPEENAIDIYQRDVPSLSRLLNLRLRTDPPNKVLTVGGEGSKAGKFKGPAGIAITQDQTHLAISDAYNHRVQVFTIGYGNSGEVNTIDFKLTLGTFGHHPGQFNTPTSIQFDASGKLHIFDKGNRRIQLLDAHFSTQKVINLPLHTEASTSLGTILENGEYLLIDQIQRLVHRVGPNGELLQSLGKRTTEGRKREYQKDRFLSPYDAAVDAAGNIYISDQAAQNIKKFTPQGKLISSWGEWGSQNGKFYKPKALTYDKDKEHLHALDFGNYRNQIFNLDGEFHSVFNVLE